MSHKTFSLSNKRIFVAGHNGMVGRAVVERLKSENCEILTAPRAALDLMRQSDVENWFKKHRPDAVIMAAAKVGGIVANASFPADFLLNNLLIETNTIHAAFQTGVEKFLLLGSSCIYPKHAPQPIKEESLLSGPLEPTNEWYAIAKIAGLKLCEALSRQHNVNFIAAMPCNLYGIGDNFDLQTSHVIPALMRKIHEAKKSNVSSVTLWGTGTPLREFLFVEDVADGLVFVLKNYSGMQAINLGYGEDLSIAELAKTIARVVGYQGEFVYDTSKPDGTPRKLLDSSVLNKLGWQPKTPLETGLRITYDWFTTCGADHAYANDKTR